jgi:tripartite-type tricarboxylate transporter receptor subunit TctC
VCSSDLENVGAAGGTVGSARVAAAAPDGYTLLAGSMGSHVAAPVLTPNIKYDARDFVAIGPTAHSPAVIVARKDFPAKDLREFVDYAKKNPDMITVGNSGAGGGVHLVALAFENAAGIKLNHIPFSGGGPSVTALLGGHVNAVSVTPPEGVSQIKAGQLKIIALFADKRLAMFPDVPTVKEQGINFSMGMWRGLVAPKGTPQDVIQKLNDSFRKAMDDPEFQARAKEMSVILSYLGPKDFGALMAKDDEFFGKLIKEMKK